MLDSAAGARATLLHVAITVAALVCCGVAAHAGGGSFGDDDDQDDNAGAPVLGFVRDRDGGPVADAKVSISVKNAPSVTIMRSDAQGHYFMRGFTKDVNVADVEVACSKDGFALYAQSRAPTGGDPKDPIEVDCVLEKK